MNHLLMPLLLMLLLAGCGKTGALYLPGAEQGNEVKKTPVEEIEQNEQGVDSGSL